MTLLVAGHRIERLGDSRVLEQLPTVLKTISDAAAPLHLRILTGVTQGTDTAACEAARELGCELHLIVPGVLDPSEKEKFGASRAVAFGGPLSDDGKGGKRDNHDAIRLRDQAAIEFADMLLVVWDGQEPHGHSGGTVRLIYQAAMRAIPVIWLNLKSEVNTFDPDTYKEHWRLNFRAMSQDTGYLKTALFPHTNDSKPQAEMLGQWVSRHLPGQWRYQLADSASGAKGATVNIKDLALIKRMKGINKEKPAVKAAGVIDGLIQSAVAMDGKGLSKAINPEAPPPAESSVWKHETVSQPLLLDKSFDRADLLANVMGKRHRDSMWVVHLLAAFAVFGAVMGVLDSDAGGGYLWPVLEAIVLAIIMGTVWISNRWQWHRTWLQARWLAELIRGLYIAYPVMAVPVAMKAAVKTTGKPDDASTIEIWIAQNLLREQGIPDDSKHPVISRKASLFHAKAMLEQLVSDQQKYHEGKHGLYEKVHHRLHRLTILIFFLAIAAVLAHFWLHSHLLIMFTVVGPALGSALHGVQSKLEYARLAMRSGLMHKVFQETSEAFKKEGPGIHTDTQKPEPPPEDVFNGPSDSDWNEWLEFAALAEHTVEVISSDSEYWKGLVEHHGASLPA